MLKWIFSNVLIMEARGYNNCVVSEHINWLCFPFSDKSLQLSTLAAAGRRVHTVTNWDPGQQSVEAVSPGKSFLQCREEVDTLDYLHILPEHHDELYFMLYGITKFVWGSGSSFFVQLTLVSWYWWRPLTETLLSTSHVVLNALITHDNSRDFRHHSSAWLFFLRSWL